MKHMHERVAAALDASGCAYTVRYHSDIMTPIKSPAEFAAALGLTQDRITKTLFLSERSAERRHILLCCPSTARVDFRAVSAASGYGRVEVANPDELNAVLGYPRNGVSPLGVPSAIPVLVDDSLLLHPSVLIGAGEVEVEIELVPDDLVKVAQAMTGTFAKE